MEIVHATWEKRNLGVDSYKMTVTDSDTWNIVQQEESKVYGDYLVIKIPTGRPDIYTKISELGYYFIEAQVFCHYDVSKEYRLSLIEKRIANESRYEKMSPDDIQDMYKRIMLGVFKYDTVSVDPFFSADCGDRRYVGEITDAIECGREMYNIFYHDEIVGFMGLTKRSDGNLFLGPVAIYPESKKPGFGFLPFYFSLLESGKAGVKKMYGCFSSNNLTSFSLHMNMGFVLDSEIYIFVKHNKMKGV